MRHGFYRAFEDRYRGSRELICDRLKAYLPFIAPLRKIYEPARALDLGCGRGEWLQLLKEQGFEPHGVDLDDGMLSACAELGLPVTHGDILQYLQSLDDDSQCIVSAFHVVEHVNFEILEALVFQSLRVLKPGGLLILETPNPENIIVGSNSFYLDPTHLRPLPPSLLGFLPEYHGFFRVRTVRLQEPDELHNRSDLGLLDVFIGVSPDYSVVAQKAAPSEILDGFNLIFDTKFGLELGELTVRYDRTVDRRITAIDARVDEIKLRVCETSAAYEAIVALHNQLGEITIALHRTEQAFEKIQLEAVRLSASDAERRISNPPDDLNRQESNRLAAITVEEFRRREARIDELCDLSHQCLQRAYDLEAERDGLRRSLSWRVTAPFRFIANIIYSLRGLGATQRPYRSKKYPKLKRMTNYLLQTGVTYARSAPIIHRFVMWGLSHAPGIGIKLRQAYISSQIGQGIESGPWNTAHKSGGGQFEQSGYQNNDTDSRVPSNGLNSSQRTPLEKYFFIYRGRK